jgi:hypothetical protein
MADDLGQKPMPGIGGAFQCHAVSLARLSSPKPAPDNLPMPDWPIAKDKASHQDAHRQDGSRDNQRMRDTGDQIDEIGINSQAPA